ncbi:MAG: chemotaxis protein CheW [Nitrospinae bacterium]|nr:chemotaxis protein CheW [Nitrospinota bacterium]
MSGARTIQVLLFGVGATLGALPLAPVERVTRMVAVTPLPGGPEVVSGIVSYHGLVTPVISLRRRFGIPEHPLPVEDHLIFFRTRHRLLALQVDRTGDTVTIPESALEAAGPPGPGFDHLQGVARLPDGILLLHDPELALTPEEALRLEEAL